MANRRSYAGIIATVLALIALLPANATAGKFKVIYSFQGGTEGTFARAPLIDINGTLYGVAAYGGTIGPGCQSFGCGTVFSVTPAGVETVLHRFQGGSSGSNPSSLVKVGDALVGIAQTRAHFIIFCITPQGSFSIFRAVPESQNLSWDVIGPPLTQVGSLYYGVVSGEGRPGTPPCSQGPHGLCGYIFALAP